jgi:hypothetical protein
VEIALIVRNGGFRPVADHRFRPNPTFACSETGFQYPCSITRDLLRSTDSRSCAPLSRAVELRGIGKRSVRKIEF